MSYELFVSCKLSVVSYVGTDVDISTEFIPSEVEGLNDRVRTSGLDFTINLVRLQRLVFSL